MRALLVLLLATACGGADDTTIIDGATASDGPAAIDADPAAPDATPGMPDATPGAADATPGAPDGSSMMCDGVGESCIDGMGCAMGLSCWVGAGGGVCAPAGPGCGGFAGAVCPPEFPVCMYLTDSDFGPCVTMPQRDCVCSKAPGTVADC